MAVQALRRLFTVTQYQQMVKAGIFAIDERVELLNGEIITMAAIGFRHASCVLRLNSVLGERLRSQVLVSVQNPIQLGERSQPQPDVALLHPRDDFYRERLPQAADIFLIIEVADSSLEYDRDIKIPLYAQHDIREVWLVDVEQSIITVYRNPTPNGYTMVQSYQHQQVINSMAFPDVTFTIDSLV